MARAVVTLLACLVVAGCSSHAAKPRTRVQAPPFLKVAHDPAPRAAFTPVKLLPLPPYAAWQCRRVQRRSPFRILCPRRLPRPTIGWPPGRPPPKLFVARLPYPGVSFTYGFPWEPDSGPEWRRHVWRNRPCCFLHFEVFRRPPGRQSVPAGSRPALVGGKHGLLKQAAGYRLFSGAGNSDIYFGNHVRFLWSEDGEPYVASLHYFGRRATLSLLDQLVRELRPAAAL